MVRRERAYELNERWLLKHYGLAVHMRAHLLAMLESIHGGGCCYPVSPQAKLNWKRDPKVSTFLWKLCTHVLGILCTET